MCNHQDEQGKVGLYRNNPKGWLPVNLPTYCSSQIINFLPNNGTGSAPYVNCTALVSVDHISWWMSNTDMTDKPNLKRVSVYRKVKIMFVAIRTTPLMELSTFRTFHTMASWPRYSTFDVYSAFSEIPVNVTSQWTCVVFSPSQPTWIRWWLWNLISLTRGMLWSSAG